MKILRFVKKMFFIGLTILSNFTKVSSLTCISMNNQPCKARPQIVNVNSNNPIFYPFSIKKVNVVAIVIILMTHMREFVFLIL